MEKDTTIWIKSLWVRRGRWNYFFRILFTVINPLFVAFLRQESQIIHTSQFKIQRINAFHMQTYFSYFSRIKSRVFSWYILYCIYIVNTLFIVFAGAFIFPMGRVRFKYILIEICIIVSKFISTKVHVRDMWDEKRSGGRNVIKNGCTYVFDFLF